MHSKLDGIALKELPNSSLTFGSSFFD